MFKYLITAMTLSGILMASSQANAANYCVTLARAIHDTDTVLDANGVTFASLGDLTKTVFVSFYTGNTGPFNLLNGTLGSVSGGAISFTDPADAYNNIGKCGLFSLLIQEIRD